MLRSVLLRRTTASASSLRLSQRTLPVLTRSFQSGRIGQAQATPRYKEDPNATVDVELPDPLKEKRRVRNYTIVFAITMVLSFVGIVKYEDANAPVVSSTLYTLRRSEKGRQVLGNNIQFKNSLMPWVSGKLQSGRGVVDFSYEAVGELGSCTVHFDARRDPVHKQFVVLDWSITTEDGQKLSLMDEDYYPFVPGSKEDPTRRRAPQA